MRTVYKYPLGPISSIEMPYNAKPLFVDTQSESPMIWCEVETAQPTVVRTFICYPTGVAVDGKYVGSFLVRADNLVFHVYDLGEQQT